MLWPRPSLAPQFHFISSFLLLNFISHFVKILTSPSISFSIFSPPHICGLSRIILPSTPHLCSHNLFLLSLEKQRKRHDGAPNKMFVHRKTITKISTWENEKVRLQKCLHRRIIFCIHRKKYFTAASTMHKTFLHFLHTLLNSYILYII